MSTSCSSCGKPVLPHFRRCSHCGAWLRPWSVGGKPSTWNRYNVGGAGRPEDWGAEIGAASDAAGSVWVQYGPKGDHVRQTAPNGEAETSGARARRGRERAPRERAPRVPRLGRNQKA